MMMEKQKPYMAVMFIQLSFAGFFSLAKLAISDSGMKPSVFVAYRQAFAFLALAPFAFICNKGSASPPLPWLAYLKIFLISSYGLTLTMILTLAGLKYTSATFATALLNIAPVFVFVMAVFCRIEKLAIREWHGIAKVLGTMFGFLGVMVFTFYKGASLFSSSNHENSHPPEKSTTHTTKDWIKGSSLLVAGEFTWSMWLTMQGPLLKQYPGNILRLTILQTGFSCLAAFIYGASVERNISSWKLGWNVNLLTVAYCGIIVNGLASWLQTWVIEKKGAVFSANFGPVAVVFAAIISIIFLKETLYLGSILGTLLLASGLYIFLWGTNKEALNNVHQNLDLRKEAQLECTITSISPTHEDHGQRKAEDQA